MSRLLLPPLLSSTLSKKKPLKCKSVFTPRCTVLLSATCFSQKGLKVDLMALLNELMTTTLTLVTKPFFLGKWAIFFCLKTTFIVVYTWIELIKATVNFHLNMMWGSMLWTAAIISLPVQVLTALQREKLLEEHLYEMHLQLETLVWDRKELEDRLQKAVKERGIVESMLAELEDEHDKAMAKIELLESEVNISSHALVLLQDLKCETLQMREISHKGRWNFKSHDDTDNRKNVGIADNHGIPSWKSGFKGSEVIFQDLVIPKDTGEGESKSNTELLKLFKTGLASSGTINSFTPDIIPRNVETNGVLDQRRGVAVSQSVFGALLSLLVGMIIWEAEDPCMPLVVALFTVVGMSLKSVVQLFSTIKNKPASDAVALLSFNWFILGTLTYPTLPRVARMLSLLAVRFGDQTMSWIGFSST
ncbi:hypothetical protein Ddye_000512 [Dipteronia dyeriana]|uniref:Uncharacterized protein n=1 Tax=Dipteronia dyeriana TaxID=168575 RepID=A0AAD9XMF0_9ROSI|nr:hypothetical protein Ddye_000512 [Dipteronia dyeriana]